MFTKAYQLASSYTLPLIISLRYFDKSVECAIGAVTVVNDEGWVLTAAHVIQPILNARQHAQEIANYQAQCQAIETDPQLTAKQKRKKIKTLRPNPKWITNFSYWWGKDGIAPKGGAIDANFELDLAFARLEPFNPADIPIYPVFKDPARNISPGTSLCKLGFPFHQIQATFDEATSGFALAPGALPVPRFPLEGIYTRDVLMGRTTDGKYEKKFIETSSPGLRGQSGGPIFDVKGTVWAIQSQTMNFPLGFNPKITQGKKEVEEHQFLNVGLGVHCQTIVTTLRERNIKFALSDY